MIRQVVLCLLKWLRPYRELLGRSRLHLVGRVELTFQQRLFLSNLAFVPLSLLPTGSARQLSEAIGTYYRVAPQSDRAQRPKVTVDNLRFGQGLPTGPFSSDYAVPSASS